MYNKSTDVIQLQAWRELLEEYMVSWCDRCVTMIVSSVDNYDFSTDTRHDSCNGWYSYHCGLHGRCFILDVAFHMKSHANQRLIIDSQWWSLFRHSVDWCLKYGWVNPSSIIIIYYSHHHHHQQHYLYYHHYHYYLISKGVTSSTIQSQCISNNINVRVIDDVTVGVSFGEAITKDDTLNLLYAFGEKIW